MDDKEIIRLINGYEKLIENQNKMIEIQNKVIFNLFTNNTPKEYIL